MRRTLAIFVNDLGLLLDARGFGAAALACYRAAHACDPRWTAPAFNLGLEYKRRRDWTRSLEWNRRACAVAERGAACFWNLGIAATALGDWTTARYAWRGYGVPLDDGDGPIAMQLGTTPIRIVPDASAEVVWTERIDPARAIIRSVPLPDSGRRYGDLVLHDGEPRGKRMLGEHEVSVFDEIALLESSRIPTYQAEISGVGAEAIATLEKEIGEAGFGAENWSQSIHLLCAACSEGRPHAHGEHHPRSAPPRDAWTVGIGAPAADVERILAAWRDAHPDARVEVQCVLE
ncbi:MAG TPA: hypothetical protein VFO79_15240 [Xanthomonadales bacterium]|nr:hypothetical protein [Xanthomonadales bacterium]